MDEINGWQPSEAMKPGDTVTMTLPKMIKRPWWAFWRPRWTEGPLETKRYKIIEGCSSTEPIFNDPSGWWDRERGESSMPSWLGHSIRVRNPD